MTQSAFASFEQNKAFSRVSSFTIIHPKRKGYAAVNFAYPADGAGRLTCYVIDAFGNEGRTCSKGTAGGYGYPQISATAEELLKLVLAGSAPEKLAASILEKEQRVVEIICNIQNLLRGRA